MIEKLSEATVPYANGFLKCHEGLVVTTKAC
jgi:hypothetical protein